MTYRIPASKTHALMGLDGLESAVKPKRKLKHPERDLTIACADWCRVALRDDIIWTHFPAGEARSAKTGALLKSMGVRRGIPDFLLFGKNHGGSTTALFIEMKTSAGRVSHEQADVIQALTDAGFNVTVARSIDEFRDAVRAWFPTREF